MRNIDLNEWVPSGAGATAASYNHKTDTTLLLKVFLSGILNDDYADKEYQLSKDVDALGIRTPKALEMGVVGTSKAIIYERITGKKSLSRLCADNPEKISEYAVLFARECHKLHGTSCNIQNFPSRKEQVLKAVKEHKGYSNCTKQVVEKLVGLLDDTSTCLHGDLQTGNLIIAHDTPYWIDLGCFAWGNPMYDLACLYFFCCHPIGQILGRTLCHLKRPQLRCFWNAFAREYSPQNSDAFTESVSRYVVPYLVYTISIESYGKLILRVFDAYINHLCRKIEKRKSWCKRTW